jgi:competence protein ComEC
MGIRRLSRDELDERRREMPELPTLEVTFCDIGQGDCTILKLPNNRVVVVDCGTSRWGNATVQSVRAKLPMYNGAPRPIDALVLSHPDKDHYNQCYSVIGSTPIARLFYSRTLPEYKAYAFRAWWWGTGAVSAQIAAMLTPTVAVGSTAPVQVSDGGPNCKVWAIASNVQAANPNNAYGVNTSSIVVRAVFGTQSVIILGDATCDTENFMLANAANYAAAALGSNLMRVGHHGSQTSSQQAFLNAVAATDAVVSISNGSQDGLPRQSPMTRVLGMVSAGAGNHQICYYADDGRVCVQLVEDAVPRPAGVEVTPPTPANTSQRLWVTGISGTVEYELTG